MRRTRGLPRLPQLTGGEPSVCVCVCACVCVWRKTRGRATGSRPSQHINNKEKHKSESEALRVPSSSQDHESQNTACTTSPLREGRVVQRGVTFRGKGTPSNTFRDEHLKQSCKNTRKGRPPHLHPPASNRPHIRHREQQGGGRDRKRSPTLRRKRQQQASRWGHSPPPAVVQRWGQVHRPVRGALDVGAVKGSMGRHRKHILKRPAAFSLVATRGVPSGCIEVYEEIATFFK